MQAATAHPQSEALSLMPQLDGVRAIAISAVLLAHFPVFPALVQIYAMQPGQLGVRLFFVLSGFLITRILLHCRDLVESGTVSLGPVLRRFYMRRALRIFPLYFLVVGVFAWLGAPNVREHLVWHLTYTTNFRMAALASNLFPAGHFWSLAIEEQFYAVWPLLALVLPRRWLGPGLKAVIAIGVLSRIVLTAAGWERFPTAIFTTSCLDSLGLGALLAWGLRERPEAVPRGLSRALALGLPLFALGTWLRLSDTGQVVESGLSYLGASLCFTWLVGRAAHGFGGWAGAALAWGPVRYLGKISYGAYVAHWFLMWILPLLFTQAGRSLPAGPWGQFLLLVGSTVAVASLSWHVFERPLNGLKRHFRYGSRDAVAKEVAAATGQASRARI